MIPIDKTGTGNNSFKNFWTCYSFVKKVSEAYNVANPKAQIKIKEVTDSQTSRLRLEVAQEVKNLN